jgi:hypothetical protein
VTAVRFVGFSIFMDDIARPACAYCGSSESLNKKPSAIKRFESKAGFRPRIPICSKCFCRMKNSTEDFDRPSCYYQTHAAIKETDSALQSFKHGSSLESFLDFIERMEVLEKGVKGAEMDFQSAADKAAMYAKKLSELSTAFSSCKELLAKRIDRTYESLRKLANRVIRNQPIRRAVFERDGYKCKHCGTSEFLSVDHITPVRRNGNNSLDNFQTLCIRCNATKRDN